MTTVKWVLEGDLWEDGTTEALSAALKKAGIDFVVVSAEAARNGLKSLGDKEECILFYGSLETATQVVSLKNWLPGNFYTPLNYNCTKYYPVFGNLLLNARNYGFYPYGDLLRIKDMLFDNYSIDNAIFIRPNDGAKSFTGKLILKENFEKDVEYCGFYGISPHKLVVVSEPANIEDEWRFFICDHKVVTGSQYKKGSNVVRIPQVPQEAIDFAGEAAKLYNPDGVWSLDVCHTKAGNYWVLEIGCMSCSGLYACDIDKLVEVASKKAIQEYEEYQAQV